MKRDKSPNGYLAAGNIGYSGTKKTKSNKKEQMTSRQITSKFLEEQLRSLEAKRGGKSGIKDAYYKLAFGGDSNEESS